MSNMFFAAVVTAALFDAECSIQYDEVQEKKKSNTTFATKNNEWN